MVDWIGEGILVEELVCQLWQGGYYQADRLRLLDGRKVRVINAGHWNRDAGPDFLESVVAFGPGKPVPGDVEIHIRTSDWWNHGHQDDPRYNRVILHVVFWDNRGEPVSKQNGQMVPTLVLGTCLAKPLSEFGAEMARQQSRTPPYPCSRFHGGDTVEVSQRLLQAGQDRFAGKVTHFQSRMAQQSVDQVFYEGLMEAAGYAQNRYPMRELAQQVELDELITLSQAMDAHERILWLQAILFHVAGLVPDVDERLDQGNRKAYTYLCQLRIRWRSLAHRFGPLRLVRGRWLFFRLRPVNFPTLRLAGISWFVARSADCRLMNRLVALWQQIQPHHRAPQGARLFARRARQIIDQMMRPAPENFWSTHYTLEGRSHKPVQRLIGLERQGAMLVNVLLPGMAAYFDRLGNATAATAMQIAYQTQRPLQTNSVTRLMGRQVLGNTPERIAATIRSEAIQQGLIQIYRHWCHAKQCQHCPLREK